MKILVNGTAREVPEHCSLGALVPAAPGVAAAVNGHVVRVRDWDATPLREGDSVEVVTAFQGG